VEVVWWVQAHYRLKTMETEVSTAPWRRIVCVGGGLYLHIYLPTYTVKTIARTAILRGGTL